MRPEELILLIAVVIVAFVVGLILARALVSL